MSARVLNLDENSLLWLSVDKPVTCIEAGNNSFDIVLNYHQDIETFELDILGEAQLLTAEQINSLPLSIKKEHKKGKLIL